MKCTIDLIIPSHALELSIHYYSCFQIIYNLYYYKWKWHNDSLAYDTKQTIICLEITLAIQMLFTVRHAVYQNNVTTS